MNKWEWHLCVHEPPSLCVFALRICVCMWMFRPIVVLYCVVYICQKKYTFVYICVGCCVCFFFFLYESYGYNVMEYNLSNEFYIHSVLCCFFFLFPFFFHIFCCCRCCCCCCCYYYYCRRRGMHIIHTRSKWNTKDISVWPKKSTDILFYWCLIYHHPHALLLFYLCFFFFFNFLRQSRFASIRYCRNRNCAFCHAVILFLFFILHRKVWIDLFE